MAVAAILKLQKSPYLSNDLTDRYKNFVRWRMLTLLTVLTVKVMKLWKSRGPIHTRS